MWKINVHWWKFPVWTKTVLKVFTKYSLEQADRHFKHSRELLLCDVTIHLQLEVDEYQNYEKALAALTEASRCLAKVTSPHDMAHHQRVLDALSTRMALVKKFVDIRR